MIYSRKPKNARKVISEYSFRFLFWFLAIFMVVFTGLYTAGFIPEEFAPEPAGNTIETAVIANPGQEPVRIKAASVGIDSPIQNPASQEIDVLDEALKKGAVRYPTSGLAGEGHMFLFGHSTGFKIVNNPAYKAFNGLKNLKEGEVIIIESKEKQYLYEVEKVSLVDANEALVELSGDEKKLTISTCNTFGEKQERYVVEARFIESKPFEKAL